MCLELSSSVPSPAPPAPLLLSVLQDTGGLPWPVALSPVLQHGSGSPGRPSAQSGSSRDLWRRNRGNVCRLSSGEVGLDGDCASGAGKVSVV